MKLATSSERQGNHAQTSESDVKKVNKQPLEQIAAIIQTSQLSESNSEAKDCEQMSEELMRMDDQPPIKTPVCVSENQIEVLQTSETLPSPRNTG